MKYTRFILIAVVAVFLGYFFFIANRDIGENKAQSSTPQQQTSQGSFETNTDEQGQVTVKVTPQTMTEAQWKFGVVFDTHSVELDQNLMQIAELADDQGNVYKPISWEGAEPGGHHREGALVFQSINPTPVSVELKIKDLGGVPERSFKWNFK